MLCFKKLYLQGLLKMFKNKINIIFIIIITDNSIFKI